MASMQPSTNNNPGKSKADPGRSQDLTLEALKVDHNVVTKELAKFRACDPHTRTLYCREWAQLIYKRHFAYNAKTQEEMAQLRTISGPGGYQLCVGGPGPDTREIASSVCTRISKQMESCFLGNKDSDLGAGEFVSNLLNECESWQKLPNSMSWLPEYFDYIVFDSFPDAIPLPDDPKDPSQLLDAVVIDRSSLALPSTCFHLLKNLSAEVLASQSEPICGHRKPMAKTPADLELERAIFTEKFEEVTKAAYNDIEMLLGDVWKDLNNTISGLKSLMADWRKEMGPDLLMAISEFCRNNRDQLIGFNEYWNPRAETFKKKKGTTSFEDVDGAFFQYLEIVRGFGQIFDKEFMRPRYEAATNLVSSLQALCGDVLSKKLNDMEQHGIDKYHKAVLESCSSARSFVLKPEHTESVQENVEAVQHKMEAMLQEYYREIDTVKEQYSNESQKTVIGRLEKLTHKDFKKRVKKLESLQQNLRQVFAADFMISIFPEQQFAQMALVTLISIMQEGEQMECDQMDDYMFEFVEENEDLLAQRDDLILDFEEGVHTGRTQLAGLIGKLFLNEGMRLQGDSLALKRQNNLLKSMGMASESAADTSNPESGSSSKKKKKKKKKKNASGVTPSEGDSSELLDKSTLDESELQQDDSIVVKVEEDVQSAPAFILKEKTPVKEQIATYAKIDQSVRKTDITSKVSQLIPGTKSPVQQAKTLSDAAEVGGKASGITSEPATKETAGHKKSKKANGRTVLSDANPDSRSNSISKIDITSVPSQTQDPQTLSSWNDSNQKGPSSTRQIWGQGIMPPPKSDSNVWRDLKTETSDQFEVNDSDVQLNFDLSSIMDDNEKKNQKIIKQDVQKAQDIPSAREDNVLENSVRSANDNSARLPPGLQVASPAISHASAASLDNMSQQQPANVLAMVANLQAENGQLLNALLSVQQDLNNMSIRYNELVKLAREREAIKANEMEEARRYILKLEAKLHLLEQDDTSSIDPHDHVTGQRRQERKRQPLSKPNRPSSSGGGENQDRRRTNNMWRDTRAVKCGNCGEPGHKSADCQVRRI
ncbi:hypothetical protein NQZ79_g1850 [Umbelopsis isabellina]|nr:hypothetical protein NQZ79_g1850 [Umbelopsis isabellina]